MSPVSPFRGFPKPACEAAWMPFTTEEQSGFESPPKRYVAFGLLGRDGLHTTFDTFEQCPKNPQKVLKGRIPGLPKTYTSSPRVPWGFSFGPPGSPFFTNLFHRCPSLGPSDLGGIPRDALWHRRHPPGRWQSVSGVAVWCFFFERVGLALQKSHW